MRRVGARSRDDARSRIGSGAGGANASPPARGLGWPPASRVSSRHRSRNCNSGAPGRAARPRDSGAGRSPGESLRVGTLRRPRGEGRTFGGKGAGCSGLRGTRGCGAPDRGSTGFASGGTVLGLLAREDWSARDLQSIATSDPVLAAELIRAANSAAFGARQEIKTLAQAVAHIGTEKACPILVAASLKRLFVVKTLHGVWNHSLEASQIAQSVAKLSPCVNPEEALPAGLVHDIGRLAASLPPEEFQRRPARLLAKGCTLSQVETALCGNTHSELGARALSAGTFRGTWSKPCDFITNRNDPRRCLRRCCMSRNYAQAPWSTSRRSRERKPLWTGSA